MCCLKICVYPGSFDPITNGHIDIIDRAAGICDKLIIAVLSNINKAYTFSIDERVEQIRHVLGDRPGIEIDSFSGLLIEYMKKKGANIIIRGLRAVSDFEYELQMALLNKKMDPGIETLFMMTGIKYSFLSSSAVKEIARHGGDVSGLVPAYISEQLSKKFKNTVGV